ncbi:MAG TPA: FtsQ-type POTRA domain-containing protein [Terriglobales bacterium]|nr:FtsQ-type POTRA domain-containing protein [Terriglobales bacterium]
MARKTGSTISQDELFLQSDEPVRPPVAEDLDDARMLDLDVEQESPFLRGQKRVSVRRGSLPKKTATRLAWAAVATTIVVLCGTLVGALYHYGERSWRFRVESSDDIGIAGLQNVTRSQIMEVMGGDIGRNIFFIPLDQRKKQLEQIPWVASASVMRFVPNRLEIEIQERTPVAFARVGSKILLIDGAGTLMELPASKKKYSFPVILGMNPGEPLSTRNARMKIYNDLIAQLDSGGAHYSQELSEVDLSDSDDVKVLANNPQGEVLIHLGSSDFLERYKTYEAHAQEWRQQFDKLESVDLRYDRQIIVNPDIPGTTKQAVLSPAATRAAMAAGVKPAALIHREVIHREAVPQKSIPLTPQAKSAAAKSSQGRALEQTASTSPDKRIPAHNAQVKPATTNAAMTKRVAVKPTARKPVAKKKVVATHRKPALKKVKAKAAIAHSSNTTTKPAPLSEAAKKKPSPAIRKASQDSGSENP